MPLTLERLPKRCNAYYDSNFDRYIPGQGVVFVVGTNTRGRHGAGAAKAAADYYGAPEGHFDGHVNSYYGIPTREFNNSNRLVSLDLSTIYEYAREFAVYTICSPHTFLVTAIGTGRAGYEAREIAPMFRDAENCWFPDNWRPYLEG